jgi:hypothetical protein
MPTSHRQIPLSHCTLQRVAVSGVLCLSLFMPSDSHSGLFDKALDFGKDLLAKAAVNYTNKYEQQLTQLLQSLRQPAIGNQPFIQGITPGNPYNPNGFGGQNPYDPNAPYGTPDPNAGYPYGGNPYGQIPGYAQGNQQGGSYGQTQGGYPASPNYGGYSSGDPNAYPQGQGYTDPTYPNSGYSQSGTYGQSQGGYSSDPSYGYPQTGQPSGAYGQFPNQGYPGDPNYGNFPSGNPNSYGQAQGGYPPFDPNRGQANFPPSSYPQQGALDPYNQYGGGGYPGQPAPPAQQGGYDPYQPQITSPPQQPGYAQPALPQSPTNPGLQVPEQPVTQPGIGIQLDVALLKKTVINGAETLLSVQDGDVLKDGRGNARAGDKFRMMFRANTDCYVYVIAIDGSAWAQGVFPSLTSPFANPVKQGKQYVIPENNNWFSLDQFKGIETVFFVASPEKRQDIEDILASISGRERPSTVKPQQVTEAPIIPAGFHRSQQSRMPFAIGQDSSSNQALMPTTYFTQKAGEALRVTRWFRHE